jgi:hypothetical protein
MVRRPGDGGVLTAGGLGGGDQGRAVRAEAGARGQQGVAAGVRPAHAGPLHPLLDHVGGD